MSLELKQCRGIRGATTVPVNDRTIILDRTRELLLAIAEANDLLKEDICSLFFTTTTDLTAEYPALAARQLGWVDSALLCAHEMQVPEGLDHCIRVLIHWNTTKPASALHHVYIRGAEVLRPEHSLDAIHVSANSNDGGLP
ncbi:MAG: chorismate mutase [Candidatus Marinimicrobia bacterium]|nr:chorismate mutase [Candidatus Neomarinimicrobiota bacterium]MCF7840865.1 chorismate mutase [Candidatus Neomarinimicrobiota bacterium]